MHRSPNLRTPGAFLLAAGALAGAYTAARVSTETRPEENLDPAARAACEAKLDPVVAAVQDALREAIEGATIPLPIGQGATPIGYAAENVKTIAFQGPVLRGGVRGYTDGTCEARFYATFTRPDANERKRAGTAKILLTTTKGGPIHGGDIAITWKGR